MKISDLINNYKPVYPEPYNWETTFEFLRSHPTDWNIVQELIKELKRDRKFREPIILSTPEDDTDEETGEYEPFVQNGTHRVFAHYLTNIEPVNVQHGWVETELYPYFYTEVEFKQPLTDNQYDTLIDKLRSHKVSEKLWVGCDTIAGQEDQATVYWSGREGTADLYNNVSTTIISQAFPTHEFTVNTITVHNEEEEEQIFNQKLPQ